MAHRTIVDSQDHVWDVWEVVPTSMEDLAEADRERRRVPREERRAPRIVVPKELRAGWLAFQSHTERRRIVPVPAGWNELPDAKLVELLQSASHIGKGRLPD